MSAEIIQFAARRREVDLIVEIDLYTAVGVAIRDLQEIESSWGSAQAFERLAECQALLRTVLASS